ncbi:MAG TPA: cytochrome c/FTR1 family iron permease [Candidatus Acidoferrales bacterium]|nr:cytochrome c/FTR1 family iron permease [Candidatus Acidoferrales bacterium]
MALPGARFLLASIAVLFVGSAALAAADTEKRILALVDYIGGDYRNAVQGGKVVSRLEYDEMLEFSSRSVELFKQLKAAEGGRDRAGIEKDLYALALHIKRKSGEEEVPELAQRIKDRLIATYKIATYPKALPDLAAAKIVYRQNCAQCHGETGRGDGPSAATMQPREPKPANFLDAELMSGLSPFKAFNTTTFGIEGTAMPNFAALSEEERWQAAFYVMSLRFSDEQSLEGKKLIESAKLPRELTSVRALAALTDGELEEKLKAVLDAREGSGKALAYLRKGFLEARQSDPLLAARAYLKEAVDLYEQGKRQEAYQRSVDAYLDGFELAEPALFTKDAALGRELEGRFTEFRSSIRSGADLERVRDLYSDLDRRLVQVGEMLAAGEAASGTYTVFNAALIIVREGVEAALIVGAIIAVLKATGSFEAIRFIHLGWVLALLSGIVTWGVAQTAVTVSGAQREVVEGFTAVLAAAVLFSVSYWLISKAEARKWQQYIQSKVQEAVSGGRIAALVGVSFLAVYREAFETVLFYQALWLQSPSTQVFVVWGFFAGAILLAGIIWSIFKLGMKIPLRLFFGISSALLYLLAFVFIGEGIKDLQATGWFRETPLPNWPQMPILGIYPTVETTLAQGLMILALAAALVRLWSGASARANARRA